MVAAVGVNQEHGCRVVNQVARCIFFCSNPHMHDAKFPGELLNLLFGTGHANEVFIEVAYKAGQFFRGVTFRVNADKYKTDVCIDVL